MNGTSKTEPGRFTPVDILRFEPFWKSCPPYVTLVFDRYRVYYFRDSEKVFAMIDMENPKQILINPAVFDLRKLSNDK